MEDFDLITKVITSENFVIQDFADKWKIARRNGDFFQIKHWTQDEENAIRKGGRIPYKFDKTSHIMSLILGTQRANRTDIQFLERKEADAAKVDLANAVWKYFSDVYQFPYVESDVFQDGLINQCGVFEVQIDKTRYYAGDLKVSRTPFDMVLWDTNARNYDLGDLDTGATWMARRKFYRRSALKAKYAGKSKLIDLIDRSTLDAQTNPQARPLKWIMWYQPDSQLIGVREFYERQFKTKYLIWQVGAEEPEPDAYPTKKSAEYQIRERKAIIEAANNEILAQGGQPAPGDFDVIPVECPVVMRSVVMVNGVLEEEEEFPLGDYPFVPYFAYFNDGDYWTAMERMKDPQTFFNRMLMQADYWLGTMAKGNLRIDPSMPKNKQDEVRNNWGKTGGTITAKSGQIELIEGRGPAPQIFTMAETADQVMQDAFGGANFIGLKETASESGRAVMARQQQAGLDNFTILDNMRRTKNKLGKIIGWFLTNEITAARKLRIVGDPLQIQQMIQQGTVKPHPVRPNVGYAEINTTPENTLEDLEMDVVIGEAQYSPTKLQADLAAMTDAFKSGMIPVPPPTDVAIGLLPINQKFKDEWLAQVQNQKPPVKTTLTIAFKDLPPGIQNQIEAGILGVQPDPQESAINKMAEQAGGVQNLIPQNGSQNS